FFWQPLWLVANNKNQKTSTLLESILGAIKAYPQRRDYLKHLKCMLEYNCKITSSPHHVQAVWLNHLTRSMVLRSAMSGLLTSILMTSGGTRHPKTPRTVR